MVFRNFHGHLVLFETKWYLNFLKKLKLFFGVFNFI